MRRTGIAAVVVLLVFAGTAEARTVIESENPRYQKWVNQARVPTPDATITVIEAPCPSNPARGCTHEGSDTIWTGPETRPYPRRDFLHELGHQFDYHVMPEWARNRFRSLIGEERPWRSAPSSPHEKFAEGYSLCAKKRQWARSPQHWGYDYWPGLRAHHRVCRLVRVAY